MPRFRGDVCTIKWGLAGSGLTAAFTDVCSFAADLGTQATGDPVIFWGGKVIKHALLDMQRFLASSCGTTHFPLIAEQLRLVLSKRRTMNIITLEVI